MERGKPESPADKTVRDSNPEHISLHWYEASICHHCAILTSFFFFVLVRKPTQFFLVTNTTASMHHLVCDVIDVGCSFDFYLEAPVMELSSTTPEKKTREN